MVGGRRAVPGAKFARLTVGQTAAGGLRQVRRTLRGQGGLDAVDAAGTMYKAPCVVECTFALFKQVRRFATRYEKTLRNYTAMVE